MRVRHSTKLTDLEHKITLKHDRKSNVNNKFHKQSGFVDADSFIDFTKFSINFGFFCRSIFHIRHHVDGRKKRNQFQISR